MVGAHEATAALAGLPLAAATGAAWEEACARAPDRLLSDHAHCELKAASTAMRLVGRYADRTSLALALTDLAREELRHFERVHALVLARGRPLSPVGPDTYVKRLRAGTMRGIAGATTLLDLLVACAFVEARSCERFRLLARGPFAADCRALWADFAGAEARHHEVFLDLAREATDASTVAARVRAVAEIEAAIVRDLPAAPRIH